MCKGGRLTVRLKLKILDLYERNLSVLAIKDRLQKEDSVKFSRTTIYSFLKRHKSCGILTRRRRTVNPASVKLKELHLKFIDLWMDKNNELKASELQKRLFETFGLKVSTSLISTRRHSVLGWKSQTSNKTCQMISRKNKTVCFSLSLFSHVRSENNITIMLYHNSYYTCCIYHSVHIMHKLFCSYNAFICIRFYIMYSK